MRLLDIAATLLAGLTLADAAGVKQCFFAAGQKALDSYVPCSNGGGHSSCCQAGDYCLADGACYGPDTKMTYIAGCTDADYQDGSCKGGQGTCNKNTQFQGLAVCGGTNWVCCGGRGQTGVVPGNDYADTCPCNLGYATVIFNGGSTLAAVNSLATDVPTDRIQPSSSTPATTSDDSSSTTRTRSSQQTSAAATTAAAPTSTIPLSQDPTGGIKGTGAGSEPAAQTGSAGSAPDNTRLKVGLGVGIPLAAAVVGAVGVAVFCLRRKMLGGGSGRYVTQADLSTPVWQGEVAGSGLPAAENGAYNAGGGWKQSGGNSTGYTPMREQAPTPPPQYKFGGDESSLHRPESQGILQASRNF